MYYETYDKTFTVRKIKYYELVLTKKIIHIIIIYNLGVFLIKLVFLSPTGLSHRNIFRFLSNPVFSTILGDCVPRQIM